MQPMPELVGILLHFLEDSSLAVPLVEWSGPTTVSLSSLSPLSIAASFEGPHPEGLRLGPTEDESPRPAQRSSLRSCTAEFLRPPSSDM